MIHTQTEVNKAVIQPATHLDEGGKAVGGAGGVGDDGVLVLVVLLVDSNDEGGDLLVLGGGSDEDLLGSGLQIFGQVSSELGFETSAS